MYKVYHSVEFGRSEYVLFSSAALVSTMKWQTAGLNFYLLNIFLGNVSKYKFHVFGHKITLFALTLF